MTYPLKHRGERLRKLRARRGWSQERLAEAAGLEPKTISRLENNAVDDPRPETLRRVVDALGATPAQLYDPVDVAEFAAGLGVRPASTVAGGSAARDAAANDFEVRIGPAASRLVERAAMMRGRVDGLVIRGFIDEVGPQTGAATGGPDRGCPALDRPEDGRAAPEAPTFEGDAEEARDTQGGKTTT